MMGMGLTGDWIRVGCTSGIPTTDRRHGMDIQEFNGETVSKFAQNGDMVGITSAREEITESLSACRTKGMER